MVTVRDRYFMNRLVDHLFVFEGDGVVNNFPGNYTQYREWLKEKEQLPVAGFRLPVEKVRLKETGSRQQVTGNKKKPSFNEKREFELLEKDIAALTKEKEVSSNKLNSSNTPFAELQKLSLRIGEITQLLDVKELRWLELSDVV